MKILNVYDEDLIVGKKYLTGNTVDTLRPRNFIAFNSNGIALFENLNFQDTANSWDIVREIEEPQHWTWTLETCPLPPFTVKNQEGVYRTVLDITSECVLFNSGHASYTYLNKNYLYIPDRNDRKLELPCGVVR